MISFIQAGRTLKAHGVKGELELDLDPELKEEILNQGVLFIDVRGDKVPFFIAGFRDEGRLFVSFEDVTTPEAAKQLSQKDVYTDEARLSSKLKKKMQEEEAEQDLYVGYTVTDLNSGKKAVVESMTEYPGQWIAELKYGDKLIRIPFHQDLIEMIDPAQKSILVRLPEGIWDL